MTRATTPLRMLDVGRGLRDRVVELAFERGLLVLGAGENSIRLCPPLVVTREQCDFGVDTLEECLKLAG